MDQSKVSENFDAANVIERMKLEDRDKYRAADDQEKDPTSYWDGRDEQVEEKPMYDSRAGS
jgi:hypothetical protein